MSHTPTIDAFEAEAVAALEAWLQEQRVLLADDGRAMVWGDGKPIALDVLTVINALRENRRLRTGDTFTPSFTVQGSPPIGQHSPYTFAGRVGESLSGLHAVVRNHDGSGARDVQRDPAEIGPAGRLGENVSSSRTPQARLLPWRAWHRRLDRRHRAASYGGAA